MTSVDYKKEIHKDSGLAWSQLGKREVLSRRLQIRMWRNQRLKMDVEEDGSLQEMAVNEHQLSSGEPTQHLQPFVL